MWFDTFLFTFGWWRNFGSILFVQQNSRHFWTVEEFWIYSICTAKFLTFLDVGGILDLFYLYCKISDIFGQNSWHFCTMVGSFLFVLQKHSLVQYCLCGCVCCVHVHKCVYMHMPVHIYMHIWHTHTYLLMWAMWNHGSCHDRDILRLLIYILKQTK